MDKHPAIDNCDLAADQSVAERIMDVLAQFGAFKRCEDCRFAILMPAPRGRGIGVRCHRGLKPADRNDGCYGWRPRRG